MHASKYPSCATGVSISVTNIFEVLTINIAEYMFSIKSRFRQW